MKEVRQRQMLYAITYIWNVKTELVNITKNKRTLGYREQTGYQWGEGREVAK